MDPNANIARQRELVGEIALILDGNDDSLDNEYQDGFVVMRVTLPDGTWYEDVFSETGSTNSWATSERQ